MHILKRRTHGTHGSSYANVFLSVSQIRSHFLYASARIEISFPHTMESQNVFMDPVHAVNPPELDAVDERQEFNAHADDPPELVTSSRISDSQELDAIDERQAWSKSSSEITPELVCIHDPLICSCATCMQRLWRWKQVWYFIAYSCFTEDVAPDRLYVKRSWGNHCMVYCISCKYR